jgi:hypothetical protein
MSGELSDVPTFCKIQFHADGSGIVGVRRLDHALAKLPWVDTKYKLPIEIAKCKFLSLFNQFNKWPRLLEVAEVMFGTKVVKVKQRRHIKF